CLCFLLRPATSKVRSPNKKSETGETIGSPITRNWFIKNVSLTFPTAALSFCAHFHLVRHHLVKRIGLDLDSLEQFQIFSERHAIEGKNHSTFDL
ncbi:MAG: hypothetical protein ACOCM2_03175, partial [Bacteroidales bacterium]